MSSMHSLSISQARPCSKLALMTLFLLATMSIVSVQAQTPFIPIPQQLFAKPVPNFIGTPAEPNPITDVLPMPEHPFMAPNGRSNLHVDGYMSDTYTTSGPLGNKPVVTSSFLAAECGTVTFDSKGRINVVCIGLVEPRLYLLDPDTLGILASSLFRQAAPPLLLAPADTFFSTSWTVL